MKRVKVKPTPGLRSRNAATSTSPGLFIEDEAHLVKQRPRAPCLAKDAPVPPRQPFKLLPFQLAGGAVDAVYEPKFVRSTMKFPPQVTAYTRGPYAACVVCGEPTRALRFGFFGHPPEPKHMACRHARTAREAPNRHDRRRAGLPRPPMPDDVRADLAAWNGQ